MTILEDANIHIRQIFRSKNREEELTKVLSSSEIPLEIQRIVAGCYKLPPSDSWQILHANDSELNELLMNSLEIFKDEEKLKLLAKNPAFWDIETTGKSQTFLNFFSTPEREPASWGWGPELKRNAKEIVLKTMIENKCISNKTYSLILECVTPLRAENPKSFKKIIILLAPFFKEQYNLDENLPDDWVIRAVIGEEQ